MACYSASGPLSYYEIERLRIALNQLEGVEAYISTGCLSVEASPANLQAASDLCKEHGARLLSGLGEAYEDIALMAGGEMLETAVDKFKDAKAVKREWDID